MSGTSFGFPFGISSFGTIRPARDENIQLRGKIIQVLFTAPGERVNLPDFGCGLFNLIFEPNDSILAAAVEFTVGQALTRWLGDEIVVDGVDVTTVEETATIEVAYTKRTDLAKQAVRIQFR